MANAYNVCGWVKGVTATMGIPAIFFGNDILVVPNTMRRNSVRNLMCVGRYAAKVMRNERSEMEHNRSEMPANIA